MDKVSIVVPLYNRADRVNDLINMVAKQTYDNVELILVDDGSTDSPFEGLTVPDNFSLNALSQVNQGANSARNKGISVASGNYIALLDSDDYIHPTHIEDSLNHLMVRNDHEQQIVFCQVNAIRGEGVSVVKPRRGQYADENIAEYLLCRKGFIQTSTLFAKRDVFLDVTFDEKLPAGQDTDFAIRAAYKGYHFTMKSAITVDWDDGFDPLRISSTPYPEKRKVWLDSAKFMMTEKAYKADRGWHYSKALYRKSIKGKALAMKYYISALISGCYSPKMALEVFLQIVISKKNYHILSDFLISRGVK